jgi:hypothetical protein
MKVENAKKKACAQMAQESRLLLIVLISFYKSRIQSLKRYNVSLFVDILFF